MADGADRDQRDAGAPKAGYERLRAAVLSGGAGGWRLGHGVLAACGMVAWMSAFGEVVPSAPAGGSAAEPPSSPADRGAPATRPVSAPGAEQVVQVLAQMVLPLAA